MLPWLQRPTSEGGPYDSVFAPFRISLTAVNGSFLRAATSSARARRRASPALPPNTFSSKRDSSSSIPILPVLDLFLLALAAGFKMFTEFCDGDGEFLDAAVFRCHGANHGRMPAIARHHQRKHGVELFL